MREIISSAGKTFYTFAAIAIIAVCITYSNHFDNDFHFDDSHTIFNNAYIRDITNIPLFFKDARTTSSFPPNQAYRPGLTTLNAIDIWITKQLGGDIIKPKPYIFHASIFAGYIFLGIFIFFFALDILNKAIETEWNKFAALFITSWFWLHTANAETINYIIARSDSFSTLMIILAFVTYIYRPNWRAKFIYFIPMVIGFSVQETALMFVPLLFFYILFFEKNMSLPDVFKVKNLQELKPLYKILSVGLIIAGLIFWISRKLTPSTWISGGLSTFNYAITQPFVMLHYFKNFFYPNDLSADTDWSELKSIGDFRFLVGVLFVGVMIYLAFKTSEKKETRPAAFGILWFFIALLPTSSFVPFSEVLNDHRPFFPYIGLFIAVTNIVFLQIIKNQEKFKTKLNRDLLLASIALLLGAHAYGTYQRNEVWHSERSLWLDCSIKSPKNGRGLMNYGLALMNDKEYPEAEKYFKEGIRLWPQYSYLYINMAMLKSHIKDTATAEFNFKTAILLESTARVDSSLSFEDKYQAVLQTDKHRSADPMYFYAQYLCGKKRFDEALPLLKNCLKVSNSHMYARYVLMNVYADTYRWNELDQLVAESVKMFPQDAEVLKYVDIARNRKTIAQRQIENAQTNKSAQSYIDLSLVMFNEGKYNECIDACKEALKLEPNNADAYNNICCSYNQMGKWDDAVIAAEQAAKLRPGFEVAEKNYKNIKERNERVYKALEQTKKTPTADGYLSVSTSFFEGLRYDDCIKYANEALKLRPNYAEAYNNICAANSKLQKWEEAKKACEMALIINPGFVQAKTNLQFIQQQKASIPK